LKKQASSSFLKKRTKKLLRHWIGGAGMSPAQILRHCERSEAIQGKGTGP
jgi:hypothetical protein